MRTKKIPNFDIKPPKKSAFSIETPPDIPKLHTLMMLLDALIWNQVPPINRGCSLKYARLLTLN